MAFMAGFASANEDTRNISVGAQVIVEDNAGILESSEETSLRQSARSLADSTGFDIFLLTVDDAGGREAVTVAEDYYMSHYSQDDGVVYLIDMDNREVYVATSGKMIFYLTDSRREEMLDEAWPYLGNQDYAGCFQKMLDVTRRFISQGSGATYSVNTDTGEIIYNEEPEPKKVTSFEGLLAAVAAMLSGGGLFGAVQNKYKMKTGGYQYSFRENSSFKKEISEDRFVNRFVTQRRIPKANTGGGSSHSGGGGTTHHTGSGGHSFGGGGRKF